MKIFIRREQVLSFLQWIMKEFFRKSIVIQFPITPKFETVYFSKLIINKTKKIYQYSKLIKNTYILGSISCDDIMDN